MTPKNKYLETGFRLTKAERELFVGNGLYVYERRDNGRQSTIEPHVAVDFMGTIVTNFPIDFPKEGPEAYTILQGDDFLREIGAEPIYDMEELIKGEKSK